MGEHVPRRRAGARAARGRTRAGIVADGHPGAGRRRDRGDPRARSESENAANWLHLMAGTVAVVVVIPRLVLAIVAGLAERRRARRVRLPLDDPYFRRLVGGWVGEPTRVRVIPYSYTPADDARAGLDAVLARAFGNAAPTVDAPVAWGDDEALAMVTDAAATAEVALALFSLAATPEEDAHGAFLDALRKGGGAPVALVDESAFLARWSGDDRRLEDRRAAWRELVAAHGGGGRVRRPRCARGSGCRGATRGRDIR
ncbi:DUF2868 domain-containing protein [Agromyces flavus]|uniref:DUF2868 domain-containing protein n=1 Tax=Agromyces flavus TaxID=589382 RepID=UPI00361EC504